MEGTQQRPHVVPLQGAKEPAGGFREGAGAGGTLVSAPLGPTRGGGVGYRPCGTESRADTALAVSGRKWPESKQDESLSFLP